MSRGRYIIRFDRGLGIQEAGDNPGHKACHEAGISSDLIGGSKFKRHITSQVTRQGHKAEYKPGRKARSQGMTRGMNITRFDRGTRYKEEGDKAWQSDARGKNIIRFD